MKTTSNDRTLPISKRQPDLDPIVVAETHPLPQTTGQPGPPVVVDLDGTLTPTDTLHESIASLIKQRPLVIFLLPLWALRGKAVLKARVAAQVSFDPTTLPYNHALIDWLLGEKDNGRTLVLSTASDHSVAQAVADHLGFFDQVIASDGHTNNSRENKRRTLEQQFGEHGYDYAGNAAVDIEVWKGARKAIVVNASNSTLKQAETVAPIDRIFPSSKIRLSSWIRLFRFHQWAKNLLLFIPLLAAHRLDDYAALADLVLAFLSFGACASCVYITNDLLDLASDRQHPRKRNRPFASASIPISYGLIIAPIAFVTSVLLALAVGPLFLAAIAVYFVLTTAYSFVLKRYALVDCLTLAGLYTLRIIAGAAAVGVPLSFWLLTFAIFIFLSLAFAKRYTELQLQATHGMTKLPGRGYSASDAPIVQVFGIAAGFSSVLVMALYLQGETVARLYPTPAPIWAAVPLMLFWISWVWLKAHRGEMHDDPVVFAIKDRTSLAVAALIGLCFVLATFVR